MIHKYFIKQEKYLKLFFESKKHDDWSLLKGHSTLRIWRNLSFGLTGAPDSNSQQSVCTGTRGTPWYGVVHLDLHGLYC